MTKKKHKMWYIKQLLNSTLSVYNYVTTKQAKKWVGSKGTN